MIGALGLAGALASVPVVEVTGGTEEPRPLLPDGVVVVD